MLFRILLHFPDLIVEVAEELAALNLPEVDFDRLRHEILGFVAFYRLLSIQAL